jgi:hypothetical protein
LYTGRQKGASFAEKNSLFLKKSSVRFFQKQAVFFSVSAICFSERHPEEIFRAVIVIFLPASFPIFALTLGK